MLGRISTWTLIITCLHCILSATGTKLTFHDNKYEDLVIAIHPSIPENLTILTEIQKMLDLGSKYLYHATKKMAYLGSAKIVVPETWTYNPSWQVVTTETFKDADIRVDKPHVSHGTDPYTFQPGLCGEPGKYIHFTPEFLTMSESNRTNNYGDIGRVWVHEFAHLRYGVFDEYGLGTEEYPYVYLDGVNLVPTKCTNAITQGDFVGNCTINRDNTVDKSCFFVPHLTDNTAKASIMFDTNQHQVTAFCEDNHDNPDYQHNHLAKNQQNKICDSIGTWDVIKEHADLRNCISIDVPDSALRANVDILYSKKNKTANGAQDCGRPLVLLLDFSGSMSGERMFRQLQTVDKLIMDTLPSGTKLGIVTFASRAIEQVSLTSLITMNDRSTVMTRLRAVTHSGATCIGCGLLTAKQIVAICRPYTSNYVSVDVHEAKSLKLTGEMCPYEGSQMLAGAGELNEGRILLITDGHETSDPSVTDIKDEIVHSGIKVHTLAYSRDAAEAISVISNNTGGLYYYFSEGSTSTALDGMIEALTNDISTCTSQLVEIFRRVEHAQAAIAKINYVIIDSTAKDQTVFTFTLNQWSSVAITLTTPSGQVYNELSREYSLDRVSNIARFKFPTAENGTWQYSLTSSVDGTITVVVKSMPGDDENPYEFESWLSDIFGGPNRSPTRVFVYVHKGYSPVMDADVSVKVERPSGDTVILMPKDNGILPDTLANDGVYTTYFTQFSGNDRYNLDVEVKNIPGRTTFYEAGHPTYGGAISMYHNTTKPPVVVLTESFSRSGSPGAMDVSGYIPDVDTYPPGHVTDLHVQAFDTEKRTVTLTWTAPGDDLNQGTAALYDIRLVEAAEDIRRNFSLCRKLSATEILQGTLSPQEAGSTERMEIKTPRTWTTVAFALQTYDDASLVSKRSNVATAVFAKVTLVKQSPTTTSTTTSTTTTTTTTMPTTTTTTTTPTTTTMPTTTTTTTTTTKTTTPSSTTTTTTTKLPTTRRTATTTTNTQTLVEEALGSRPIPEEELSPVLIGLIVGATLICGFILATITIKLVANRRYGTNAYTLPGP